MGNWCCCNLRRNNHEDTADVLVDAVPFSVEVSEQEDEHYDDFADLSEDAFPVQCTEWSVSHVLLSAATLDVCLT